MRFWGASVALGRFLPITHMPDRFPSVYERLLRRDMQPRRPYEIRGDHPDDPLYLDVAFDDGAHVAVPKDHVWMLPRLAEIHADTRRQMREHGIELSDLIQGGRA